MMTIILCNSKVIDISRCRIYDNHIMIIASVIIIFIFDN